MSGAFNESEDEEDQPDADALAIALQKMAAGDMLSEQEGRDEMVKRGRLFNERALRDAICSDRRG